MDSVTYALTVRSPTGVVFEGPVVSATLPTPDGPITVLAHHMPLIALLTDGELRIETGGREISLALAGGFLETGSNTATVLTDFAAEAESIEIARVEEAKQRAEEIRKDQRERGDMALAERDMQRAVLQLKVAERNRARRTGLGPGHG
jgi:F-type H+-transporting ATPase subunit epsilon